MEKKGETGCCDWTLLPPSLLPLSCGPSSRFPFGPALTHGVVLSLVCSGFFSFLPLHFSFCPQRRLSMEREHFTHIPPVPLCHGLPSHSHGQGQTCIFLHTRARDRVQPHTHRHVYSLPSLQLSSRGPVSRELWRFTSNHCETCII